METGDHHHHHYDKQPNTGPNNARCVVWAMLRSPHRASTLSPHSIHMSYAQSPHAFLMSLLTMLYLYAAATTLTTPTVFFLTCSSFITYGIPAVTMFPLVYILDP